MSKAIGFALAGTLVLAGCSGSTTDGSLYSSYLTGSGGNSSSSTTGAGGGSGVHCTMASITIDGDGPTNHIGAACKDSWGAGYTSYANGYLGYPEPNSTLPKQLFINGCVNTTAPLSYGSLSLAVAQTTLGSATTGSASYANGLDTFTTDTDVTVEVTEMDSMVEKGSYTTTVASGNNGQQSRSGPVPVLQGS